jgi:DNA-binding NtrC family response regulator
MAELKGRGVDGSRRGFVLRQVKLTVVRGKEKGREVVAAADVIRIGKAPENDLVLGEDTVSRVHCEIVHDAKGWLVRDLRSTNGTFLDGAEVKEAYLRPGSVISIGAAQVKFQPFDERIEAEPLDSLGDLVGVSTQMREVFGVAARIAATDVAITIEGEPGTGREALARTIHGLSRRRAAPFVVVDCRRAPTVLDADLLGAAQTSSKPGAFERAGTGTLLLDEVSELPLDLQPRLLRALESREVRRGTAGRPVHVDARIMATASRPLAGEVERGRFRTELAARVASVTLALPPLRERGADIALLAQAFRAADGGRPLTPGELTWVGAHDWPGNLDELRDVVARGLPAMGGDAAPIAFDAATPFRELKERWSDEFERRYLAWLLDRAGGNISLAARQADMDRKYLHRLLKKHGLAETGGVDLVRAATKTRER